MLADMQLRGLAPKTQEAYLRAIRQQLPAPPPTNAPEPKTPAPLWLPPCPRCGQPMVKGGRIWPRSRWPPLP
ncbi:MAG: hypothetical protein D6706_18700 [Chloroflexi bacterium]|nr:MAG: hypothetical protein D6706_18700 [Chloroflexota bacterium]